MIKLLRLILIIVGLAFSVSTVQGQACLPTYTSGCSVGDQIESVSTTGGVSNITNLNNGCTNSLPNNTHYFNQTVGQIQGLTFSITIVAGTAFDQNFGLFIDWNQDGDYLDPTEFIGNSGTTRLTTWTTTVTVPFTATPGTCSLRVVGDYSNGGVTNPCVSTIWGETEEYNVQVIPATPCTIVNGGNAVAAPASPCPGTLFNLNLTGNTLASGLSYLWLESTVGPTGPWSTLTPSVTTQSANIPAPAQQTWYCCVVTCAASMNSDTSAPVSVTSQVFSAYSPCYCYTSTATSTFDTDIGQVVFGTLNNPATTPAPQNNNPTAVETYSNFDTLLPIPIYLKGQSYPLSIYQITSGGTLFISWAKVYIDFNHNTVFDPTEEVFSQQSNGGNGFNPASPGIVIPNTALSGLTRMRVILQEGGSQAGTIPCGGYTWGETEDYVVNILDPGPHDPAVTNIQVFPTGGCMDSCENVILTISNFGSQVLDLSINPLVVKLDVDGPLGVTSYVDTLSSNIQLQPYNANSTFLVFPCVNFYEGGCYDINTDTLTLLGSVNTNLINDSLFTAVQVCNSRPNAVDYNLCLNDTIPTGQGLGILNCPTGYVQDSVLIPLTIGFTGNNPPAPTACASTGAGAFATGTLPTLPPGANMLGGEISVNNLELAPLTFTTGPNLTRFSLYDGNVTLPTTPANIYHNGAVGNPLGSTFGCFNYLSVAPGIDLNQMYNNGIPVPAGGLVGVGHWSTNRCNATNILTNCGGTTVASLKIVYEYVPMGISWYEQPSGGVRISDSSLLNPLLTANSIVTNSNTAGTYTFYGACQADTNCRVEVDLVIQGITIDSVNWTNVLCNGDSSGTAYIQGIGGNTGLYYTLGTDTNTTGVFTNLPAGIYTINVHDSTGCSGSDSTFTITEPSPLVIDSITSTLPTCTPGGDGTMTIYASGGTGVMPYDSMSSSNAPTIISNSTFTNLAGGVTHLITIYDANGCTDTMSHTIQLPVSPSFTNITTSNALCFGDTTGTITATAVAGSSAIATYSTTPPLTQNTPGNFSGAGAGPYTVRVTDSLNCFADSIVNITSPPVLSFATAVADSTDCFGDSTGSITVTGNGGIPTYNYTITAGPITAGPNTTGSFTNLPAGTYTIQVADSNNNCTHDTMLTIYSPNQLVIDTASVTHVACNGDSSGVIVMAHTGGIGTPVYSTPSPGIQALSGTISNLPANTYLINGTDANGCTASTSVQVNQAPVLVIDSVVSTTPTCVPGGDATMIITATGGTGMLDYNNGLLAAPGQASNVFMNQIAGSYNITVTDQNGCTDTTNHLINTPGAPTWNTIASTDVICFGDTNGTITLTTNGGSGTIMYTVAGPSTPPSNTTGIFMNLLAGNYTLTAVDTNNCNITSNVVVGTPAVLSYASAIIDSVDCNGNSTGMITVTGAGGITPYSYQITAPLPVSASNTTGIFMNLAANTYTITITDSNNCTHDTILTVNEPVVLALSNPSSTNILCNGDSTGAISISHTGGTGTPTYTINPNVGTQPTNGNFVGLPQGTYTITGTDVNNCMATIQITLTEPTPLIIDSIVSTIPSCVPGNDATMTVYASGGNTASYAYYNAVPIVGVGQPSNQFTNQGAANYTITVVDANGCSVTSSHTIATPGSPTWGSVTSVNVLCNGDSTGSIAAVVIPGNDSNITTTYVLPIPGGPIPASNLPAGAYTIQAVDGNGCSITSVVNITQPNPLVIATSQVDSVVCNGDSTGGISLTMQGGTGPYTYVISPNLGMQSTAGNFTSLPQGIYTITITDANNCTTSTTLQVSEPSALQYTSVSSMNVSCNGANNGTITATGTGGTGMLSFSLTPPPFNQVGIGNFTGLNGGAKTITLQDANACTLDSIINIAEPNTFTIDTSSAQMVLCFGDSSGQLVMTSAGGTTINPVTYAIAPINGSVPGPNGTFSNLPAGTYTITATDNNGCTAVQTYTITQPASAVSITNVAGTPATCVPGNDGTITITASGGTPNLTYALNTTLPTYQAGTGFTGLVGGNYFVYVQDANGCTAVDSISLVTPGAPSFTSVTSTITTCNGDSTGSITGVATGASAITYALTPLNGGTQAPAGNFTNLPAGNYTISASDANGCSVIQAINVSEPPAITFTNVVTDSVDCNGDADGSITVNGTGGTGALTYTLLPATTPTSAPPALFDNLAANNYTVRITDANACTMDSVILVGEPPLLAIDTMNTQSVLCRGDSSGQLVMTNSGGTGTITYGITPNLGTQLPSGTFSNLPAGMYTITATDFNMCTTVATYTITEPATNVLISGITGTTPTCNPGGDGTVTVTAAGGTGILSYTLSPAYIIAQPAPSFNNLNSGLYLATAIDANGCTDTMTYNLANPSLPVWNTIDSTDALCNGDSTGTITVTITSGTPPITYSIVSPIAFVQSNATGSFTNLPAGTYTIEATDANNCSISTMVTINEPTALSFASLTSDSVSCNGFNDGQITVAGAGGTTPYSYDIPGAIQLPVGTFINLSANTYTITMTDSNNCTATTQAIIYEPTPVVIDTASSVDVLCHGDSTGSILVQSSGGTGPIYHVIGTDTNQNNPANFANYPAGMYTITAIDGNGCTSTSQLTINEPTPLTHSISSTDVLCFGDTTGTITMTGSGGTPSTTPPPYTYSIIPSTGSQATPGNFSGLGAGTYIGIVSDSNSCMDTSAIITINTPTQIVFSAPVIQNIDCYGASTGSIGIAATGGTGLKTITLTGPVNPVPQVSPANFQNLPAGTYTLTATDSNSCSITTIITLTQNPQLYFSSITNTEEICFGDSNAVITFQGAGGVGPYNYVFNVGNPPGSPTPSTQTSYGGLTTNIYNIEIIDALGCRYDSNYQILGPERINFPVFIVTPTTCLDTEDGKLTVEAAGGRGGRYTYSLEPGFYVNTNGLFRDLPPRQYTLRTMDTAGCFIDTTFDVNLPSNPLVVSLTKEDLGCHGRGNEGKAEAIATGGTPPYTYLWSSTPVQTTAVVAGLYQGFHTVDVVDANGCLVRDTLVIEPGPCCQEVFLPNAFSPNGDGRNDEFRILSTAGIELQQFEVRNRWGERIWQSNNVRSSWDGTVDGEPVDLGTYYYVMRYKCLTDGQNYTKKGDVVVVR